MDEFLERLWKSLAFVFGAFVLIYVLIATSRERPHGLGLVIYKTMNQLFSWLFWLIGFGLTVFILVSIFMKWKNDRIKEEERLAEEEKTKVQLKLADEQRTKDLEQKRKEEEERTQRKKEAMKKEQERKKEKDRYLKTRSASEANAAALKDFL